MDNNDRIRQVSLKLEDFILGKDRSIKTAGNIEVELDNLFPDDDEVQDFVTYLAMYKPEGGEYLFNAEEMVVKSKHLLNILKVRYTLS